MSEITVHYERKFSDYNYGSEGVSLTWSGEAGSYAAVDMLSTLRRDVLGWLAEHGSPTVRGSAMAELNPLPAPPQNEAPEDLPY